MRVERLKLENFRNIKSPELVPCGDVNILYGDNAQGKTNLLEAIWLFCGGHSFRRAKDSELINWEKKFAKIEMDFFGQERSQNAQINFSGNKKQVTVNGVEKKSAASLIEKFCAVVFFPEHLNLIKRGPSERRKFIDSAICREKLKNASIISKYNRILLQRNALLKDLEKRPVLDDVVSVWDFHLASCGAYIIKKRMEYIKLLSKQAEIFHYGISNGTEKLEIRYIPCVAGIKENDSLNDIGDKLVDKYESSILEDMKTRVTNFGPHRDDIEILINGKNTRIFGSQGQQRSAVLSMKLAEASVLEAKMGEKPVILLDDVLSELDNSRQSFLLNKLEGYQVFITCCESSEKEQPVNGRVFKINDGVIG